MNEDKDFVNLMFESKMDQNLFNFKDEELQKAKEKKLECNDKLFDTINTLLTIEEQNVIKNLIQDYKDEKCKCDYLENRLYYKAGLKDGLSIRESLEKISMKEEKFNE